MGILNQLVGAASSFKSVVNLFNSSFAVDVVRVCDEKGNQVFTLARAMKAAVNRESEMFSHKIENGNQITDFCVNKPTAIQMGLVVPTDSAQSVHSVIEQLWLKKTSLIVQTRARTYTDMVIQSMPHEESPEYGDCLMLTITLLEVQWYDATVEALPAKEVAVSSKSAKTGGTAKSDADTQKLGQKRSTDASSATQKKSESILHGWFG